MSGSFGLGVEHWALGIGVGSWALWVEYMHPRKSLEQ